MYTVLVYFTSHLPSCVYLCESFPHLRYTIINLSQLKKKSSNPYSWHILYKFLIQGPICCLFFWLGLLLSILINFNFNLISSHNKPSTETHRDHTLYLLLLLELEHIYKQVLQQSNKWDILYLRLFLFKTYSWQINSYLINSQNRNSRTFNTITNHSVQRKNHC